MCIMRRSVWMESKGRRVVHRLCVYAYRLYEQLNLWMQVMLLIASCNRELALLNIRHLYPSLATILINMYRHPRDLYMDGSTLLS